MQTGDETLDSRLGFELGLREDLEISWSWQTQFKATNFTTSKNGQIIFLKKELVSFNFFLKMATHSSPLNKKKRKFWEFFFLKNFFFEIDLGGKNQDVGFNLDIKSIKSERRWNPRWKCPVVSSKELSRSLFFLHLCEGLIKDSLLVE